MTLNIPTGNRKTTSARIHVERFVDNFSRSIPIVKEGAKPTPGLPERHFVCLLPTNLLPDVIHELADQCNEILFVKVKNINRC